MLVKWRPPGRPNDPRTIEPTLPLRSRYPVNLDDVEVFRPLMSHSLPGRQVFKKGEGTNEVEDLCGWAVIITQAEGFEGGR